MVWSTTAQAGDLTDPQQRMNMIDEYFQDDQDEDFDGDSISDVEDWAP